MQSIDEHLLDRMREGLNNLGLASNVIDDFEKYILGEKEEDDLFKILPQFDLCNIQRDRISKVSQAYESLKRHGNFEYLGKYLKVLLKISEGHEYGLIKRYEYVINEGLLNRLIDYSVKPSTIIKIYVQNIVDSDYSLKLSNFNYLDILYEKYSQEFVEAFKSSEVNQKFCMAVYMIYKEIDGYKSLMKWYESDIKGSLKGLFNNIQISDADLEAMKKYLDGGLFVNDDVIQRLKNNLSGFSMQKYILKFLIGSAYMTYEKSKTAKRFIRFAVLLNYNDSMTFLYEFLRGDGAVNVFHCDKIKKAVLDAGVPKEYFIAWIGNCCASERYNFQYALKDDFQNDRKAYEKAVDLSNDLGSIYLAKSLWQMGEGKYLLPKAESNFISDFKIFMLKAGINASVVDEYADYLSGKKEFDEIKNKVINAAGNQRLYIYYGNNHIKVLSWIKNVSDMYKRTLRLYAYFGSFEVVRSIFKSCTKDNMGQFVDELIEAEVDLEGILPFLSEYAIYYNNIYSKPAAELIIKFIKDDIEKAAENIKYCSADGRAYVLGEIFKDDKEKGSKILINNIDDTSKAVREKVIELLDSYEKAYDLVVPYVNAKKQAVRESAVRILSKCADERCREVLEKAYETEKTEKIKAIIAEALNIQQSSEKEQEDIDIVEYCKRALKGNKRSSLAWLEPDTLPKIRLKDSENYADEDMLKFIMISYSSIGGINISSEAKKVSQYLNTDDLAIASLEVFNRWINSGAEAKKRWVLPFASIHGDYKVVLALKKNIEEWPQHARGAIASEAVRALALNGSSEALLIVDSISRKFKFKQVKNAAADALDFAAKEIGIDREELSDKIVPNLGFDERGERIFDYGERKFKVLIATDLSLEIYDDNEKKMKNLPSVGKKDDEIKAKAALEEYKLIKKQLKTTASIQAIRLELALSDNRVWTIESWTELFVKNPIMHQFAMGLIWGEYKEDQLIETFRYMEDGTFNTKDEDEYEMKEDAVIGLVHPIEMDEETLNLWKEQLENYEVKQPFEQIGRKVYKVTEEEEKAGCVERFGGTLINALSLVGKLSNFGWYKGSTQDAGGYYNFYKENKKFKIGAELEFSGAFVGGENDEVTIYEVNFYKSGTVERGSYIYDKIKDKDKINPKDISARLFSEFLYQIDKSLQSKTGRNEHWKKDK